MPYASTTEIQIAAGGGERFVALFDWDGDTIADVNVVAQFQTQVDGWIDSYCGRRFAVPIATPTAALSLCAAEEVVYRAMNKRGMSSDDDHRAHDQRVKWLEGIASGRVVPSEPEPPAASSVVTAWVSADSDSPISREALKGAW